MYLTKIKALFYVLIIFIYKFNVSYVNEGSYLCIVLCINIFL